MAYLRQQAQENLQHHMYAFVWFVMSWRFLGSPKPILPEDMWGAKKMTDGSYKCLTCQTEELQTKY